MSGAVDYVKDKFDGAVDYVNDRLGIDSAVKGVNNMFKVNDIPKSASEALMTQTKKQVNKKEDDVKNNITNYVRYMYAQNPGASLGAGYLGL